MKNNIILASSSPRRIKIFKEHGITPIIKPPQIDEAFPSILTVDESVMFLALKKGLSVVEDLGKDLLSGSDKSFIVSADTVVYKDRIIGKPANKKEAFETLKYLRNSSHFVITGVAIIQFGSFKNRVFYDTTEVVFKDYKDEDITRYIESENVLDKAGSYAIQSSIWKENVEKIIGDYDNVVGFPWRKFEEEFSTFVSR
jgi:septum formation protein